MTGRLVYRDGQSRREERASLGDRDRARQGGVVARTGCLGRTGQDRTGMLGAPTGRPNNVRWVCFCWAVSGILLPCRVGEGFSMEF